MRRWSVIRRLGNPEPGVDDQAPPPAAVALSNIDVDITPDAYNNRVALLRLIDAELRQGRIHPVLQSYRETPLARSFSVPVTGGDAVSCMTDAQVDEAVEPLRSLQLKKPPYRHGQWIAQSPERRPIYFTEAVTFNTPWGYVTLGRGLASTYDMEGWPSDTELRSMVERQRKMQTVR